MFCPPGAFQAFATTTQVTSRSQRKCYKIVTHESKQKINTARNI